MTNNHHRIQGDVCESAAIYYFTSKGYVVSKPLNHSKYYDLIVDDGDNISRVECKSSSSKSNNTSYTVSLKTSGGNQSWNGVTKKVSSDHTDIIFIMDDDGNLYVYDAEELNGRRSVNVNPLLESYVGNMSI